MAAKTPEILDELEGCNQKLGTEKASIGIERVEDWSTQHTGIIPVLLYPTDPGSTVLPRSTTVHAVGTLSLARD